MATLTLSLPITQFQHYCGYVGGQGIAYFTCSGSRHRVRNQDLFLFSDAEELFVTTLHEISHGGYDNTAYIYTWKDQAGKCAYQLKGEHQSHPKLPPAHNKYHFALAAQHAWSQYMLARILPEIRLGRAYTFRYKGRDAISCHREYLEIYHKKDVQRYYPKDLAEVRIKEGKIAIKEIGANEGLLTSTGIHSFWFAELGNADLFIKVLNQLYDVRVTW